MKLQSFKNNLNFISQLAQWLARTPDEMKLLQDKNFQKRHLIFIVVITTLLMAIYLPSLYRALGPNLQFLPDVAVERSDWKVLYEAHGEGCEGYSTVSVDCIASPENPALWQSTWNRDDSDHQKRIQARRGKDFWIGLTMPVEKLKSAYQLKANKFVIGFFNASYRMWVDGELYGQGDGWYESSPLVIYLPLERLNENRPIKFAVQIIYNSETKDPDLLNSSSKEGLFTTKGIDQFSQVSHLLDRTRPFMLGVTYLVFALFFFIFWLPARQRPEYFYLGLYALVSGFNQFRQFELFWATLPSSTYQPIAYVITVLELGLVMLLGFSIARVRKEVFIISWGLIICTSFVGWYFARHGADAQWMKELARKYGPPVFYGLGIIACLLQAIALKFMQKKSPYGPTTAMKIRFWQLCGLSSTFTIMAAFDVFLWRLEFNMFIWSWYGLEHFLLLTFLGGIVLFDFGKIVKTASQTPVSEYHKREVIPEKVSGVIGMIEYIPAKNSPSHISLANLTSVEQDTSLHVWRSHAIKEVLAAGGCIVHHRPEFLIIFFDEDRSRSPLEQAFKTFSQLKSDGRRNDWSNKNRDCVFNFRVSLSLGSIRPIWEKVMGGQEAYWEEAGNSTPFVECARLFEMQSQILNKEEQDQAGHYIIMKSETYNHWKLENNKINLGDLTIPLKENMKAIDKHGQPHSLSIIQCDLYPQKILKNVA